MHSGIVHRTALDIYIYIDVHSGTAHETVLHLCIDVHSGTAHETALHLYILMCILIPPGEQRCGVHSGTGRGGRSLCLRQDVCV